MSETTDEAVDADCPTAATDDWREHAAWLHDECGVPPVRSRVVALREAGCSHTEVAAELGLSGKSQSAHHCAAYREQREKSERLLADAPEI